MCIEGNLHSAMIRDICFVPSPIFRRGLWILLLSLHYFEGLTKEREIPYQQLAFIIGSWLLHPNGSWSSSMLEEKRMLDMIS